MKRILATNLFRTNLNFFFVKNLLTSVFLIRSWNYANSGESIYNEYLYTKRRTYVCIYMFLYIIRTHVTPGLRSMHYQHSCLKIAQLFARFDTYVCVCIYIYHIRFRGDIKRNAISSHTRPRKNIDIDILYEIYDELYFTFYLTASFRIIYPRLALRIINRS